MPAIVAVLVIRVDPERITEAEAAFRGVIEPTHAEEGALRCALTRSRDDPALFVVVERWASSEAIDHHLRQDYTKTFMRALGPLTIGEPQTYLLEDIPIGDGLKGLA